MCEISPPPSRRLSTWRARAAPALCWWTSRRTSPETAASSITVTQISKDDLQDDLGANTGYATTKSFIGYALDFKTNGEIESGPVVSYDVMLNVTDNSVANVNSAFVALIGALNGSNAAEMVAVV